MKNTLLNQTEESSQLSQKIEASPSDYKMSDLSGAGFGQKNKSGYLAMVAAHRSRPACTCSNRPGSVRCARHGYVVPGERMMMKKRVGGSKEILRRALTPPPKRLALRWLNFRPTPSRLSNMSMA